MAGLTAVERLKFVLQVDAEGGIKALEKFGHTADKELSKAQTKMELQAGKMQAYGAGAMAMAGTAGVALFKMSTSWEQSALAAGKFASATGITSAEASRFIVVAKGLDIETSSMEKALGKMEKALGNSPEKFKALGIATIDAAGKQLSASNIFLNSVDVLNSMTTQSEKSSAAAGLFGRDWQTMSVLIGKGSDEIRTKLAAVRADQIFNDKAVDDARKFQASLKDVGNSISGLTNSIGAGAAPIFGKLAGGIAVAADAFSTVNRATGGAAGSFAAIGTIGLGLVGTMGLVGGSVAKMSKVFQKDGTTELTRFGTAAKGVSVGLGTLAASIAVIQIFDQLAGKTGDTSKEMQGLVVDIGNVDKSSSDIGWKFESVAAGFEKLRNKVIDSKSTFAEWGDIASSVFGSADLSFMQTNDAFEQLLKTSPELAKQFVDMANGYLLLASDGDSFAQEWVSKMGISADVTSKWSHEIDTATGAQKALTDAYNAAHGIIDENIGLTEDEIKVKEKAKKASEAHAQALKDEAKAEANLYDQLLSQVDAAHAYEVAQRKSREAVQGLTKDLADTSKSEDERKDAIEGVLEVLKSEARLYTEQTGDKDPKKRNEDMIKSLMGIATTIGPNSPAYKGLQEYIWLLAQIPSKVDTKLAITTVTPSGWSNKQHFASGTANAPPGVALVGEQGPELVMLNGGEHILTAAQTKSALSPSSGSSSGADKAVLSEQEILSAQFEMGEISVKQYKEALQKRLGTLEKYSSEYMSTWREIRGIEKDAADESQNNLEKAQQFKEAAIQLHLDRIRAMYKKAADQRALDDAKDAADKAVRDYGQAMTQAWNTGKSRDRKVTQEDKQNALDSAVDAGKSAAKALADRADAAAVAAGFEQGTPEYARFVRGALLQDEKNAPGLTSAIDRVLTGIPQLAKGGLITSPTVAMIGEAGPEAVVPLSKMGQMGATYNITVNTAADPNSVVAAIKRYTKNGGVL